MGCDELEKIDQHIELLEKNLAGLENYAEELSDISKVYKLEDTPESVPIRTVHHLSCTGGTLFAKCIASMPNVLVLNEINPFSQMQIPKGKALFTPTDMVALIRQGNTNFATDEVIKKLFWAELDVLRKECWLSGRTLVLRDHSHSQFLFGDYDEKMLTLRDVIGERFPVKSVVTTRKVDHAFSSMSKAGWNKHFEPSTFEEYERRHALFISRFADSPKFCYEDFTRNPSQIMQQICDALNLNFFSEFDQTFSAFCFSGDSGRGGNSIIAR